MGGGDRETAQGGAAHPALIPSILRLESGRKNEGMSARLAVQRGQKYELVLKALKSPPFKTNSTV